MIICITSEGDNLDSKIDQRFGRCQYFIFIDTDNSEFEAVQNQNLNGMGGVGVHAERGGSALEEVGPEQHQILHHLYPLFGAHGAQIAIPARPAAGSRRVAASHRERRLFLGVDLWDNYSVWQVGHGPKQPAYAVQRPSFIDPCDDNVILAVHRAGFYSETLRMSAV